MIWVKEYWMYHTVVSNHEINPCIAITFSAVGYNFAFGVKSKVEYHRVGFCNLWIYAVKNLLNVAFDASTIKMSRTKSLINDIVD